MMKNATSWLAVYTPYIVAKSVSIFVIYIRAVESLQQDAKK